MRCRRASSPHAYFVGSAIFHYLGPAFAVLLFARVDVLGVAWLRIASAALVFALAAAVARAGASSTRGGACSSRWGAVLALMNCCFYVAIDRLPLGTVAAIEFLPVVALAALGARTPRNVARAGARGARRLPAHRRAARGRAAGVALAFANAALFALYIVLAHRAAQRRRRGIDGLGGAMLVAAVVVDAARRAAAAVPALGTRSRSPPASASAISSSVIPYVCRPARDGAAAARDLRAARRPAAGDGHGDRCRGPDPGSRAVEVAGVVLVTAGVAVHRARGVALSAPHVREAPTSPPHRPGGS